MEETPNLQLPYVMANQAKKHITVNESFQLLDALVQLSVKSAETIAEPVNPTNGDIYILPAGKTGAAWSAMADDALAAWFDNIWVQITPRPGFRAYTQDTGSLLVFDGSGWSTLSGETAPRFGVNTLPDDVNRLAVKSDAELLSYDDVTPGSGDARKLINKAAPGNTASVVFQTDFSGRAELGLTGDDHFRLKVSAGGSAFQDVLSVDPATAIPKLTDLEVGNGVSVASIGFDTSAGQRHWELGQGTDQSFYLRRTPGGFGTNGKVLIYDEAGALGLWGAPSTSGKVSIVSNVNSDGVDAILYLEQKAGAVAPGVAHFRNNSDNATPILELSTATKTVFLARGEGSIELGAALKCVSHTLSDAPSATVSGAGALIFVSDETGGPVPAFSDGTDWRRVTDRAVIA